DRSTIVRRRGRLGGEGGKGGSSQGPEDRTGRPKKAKGRKPIGEGRGEVSGPKRNRTKEPGRKKRTEASAEEPRKGGKERERKGDEKGLGSVVRREGEGVRQSR
uniref:hypothetical protein n=1 Tax=Staphylococcus haemolyticus TaxID=1283 RepID=UPI001C5CBAF3